jgi:hypothetical protein
MWKYFLCVYLLHIYNHFQSCVSKANSTFLNTKSCHITHQYWLIMIMWLRIMFQLLLKFVRQHRYCLFLWYQSSIVGRHSLRGSQVTELLREGLCETLPFAVFLADSKDWCFLDRRLRSELIQVQTSSFNKMADNSPNFLLNSSNN